MKNKKPEILQNPTLFLLQIVEAMPQTQVVGDFMEKLGAFYEIVDEDSPIDEAIRKNPESVPPDLKGTTKSK